MLKYLSILFNRYQLLTLVPLIWIIGKDIDLLSEKWLELFLLIICANSLLSVGILINTFFNNQLYAPLKIILDNSNIESKNIDLNHFTVLSISAGLIFLSLFLGFYLVFLNGPFLLILGLLALSLFPIMFYKKIDLFNNYGSSFLIPIMIIGFSYLSFNHIMNYEFDVINIFELLINLLFGFLIISIDDIRGIYTDSRINKKTYIQLIGYEKAKKIVLLEIVLIYVTTIIFILSTFKFEFTIVIFSGTLAVGLLLNLFKNKGVKLRDSLNYSIILYFFYSILYLIANLVNI